MRNAIVPTSFLRRVWWADAAVSAVVGAAMAGAAGPLGELIGLPARLLPSPGCRCCRMPPSSPGWRRAAPCRAPRPGRRCCSTSSGRSTASSLGVMQADAGPLLIGVHRRPGGHRARPSPSSSSAACGDRRPPPAEARTVRAGHRLSSPRGPREDRSQQRRASRFDRLDALRGVAIVWMAAFHFCFDLNYFGFIQQNFYSDPMWTLQRTCIVTLFLLCAGAGQDDRRAPGPAAGRGSGGAGRRSPAARCW